MPSILYLILWLVVTCTFLVKNHYTHFIVSSADLVEEVSHTTQVASMFADNKYVIIIIGQYQNPKIATIAIVFFLFFFLLHIFRDIEPLVEIIHRILSIEKYNNKNTFDWLRYVRHMKLVQCNRISKEKKWHKINHKSESKIILYSGLRMWRVSI